MTQGAPIFAADDSACARMLVEDIDWSKWVPRDVATLLFVVRAGSVLLIRKKRGLGAGKINAPGGRLEANEVPLDAAVREVQEELCVTPVAPRHRGELRFEFVRGDLDGYRLHAHVFVADDCVGEPKETEEAIPLWTRLDAIPYDEMWRDDALWVPRMLSGYRFEGRFVFEGDAMLDHRLELVDPAAGLLQRLAALGIDHELVTHPPVFTVAEAQRYRVRHDGVHVKNLFLRNKKGKMWLVTLPEDKPVDLKSLAKLLDAGHLSFGSAERLRENLGVEPGSVTPLAALFDTKHQVQVVLDASLADAAVVHCHPMTNDRTLALRGADLARILRDSGHAPNYVSL